MKFWDSSALIPLIVPEPETRPLGGLFKADPAIAAWWGSRAECTAALARLERDRRVTGQHMAQDGHLIGVEALRPARTG